MRRTGAPRELPPPLELECLKALWRLSETAADPAAGEATVKQVREVLAEARPLAYTTVMTLLERLVKRGRVGRRKQGRAFLYSALATRSELRKRAVDEMVLMHFDGSRDALRTYLDDAGAPVRVLDDLPETRLDAALL